MPVRTRSMAKKQNDKKAGQACHHPATKSSAKKRTPKKPAAKRKAAPKKTSSKKKPAPKKKAVKKQPKKKQEEKVNDNESGFGVGSDAPDFDGVTNERGETVSLADYAGQDNTPGCTKEGQRFRDLKEDFSALNCEILGVSADKEAAHQKFIDKYEFNFSLLADTERKIIRAYGATKPGNRIQRSTFLIDPDGVIVKVWNPVRGAATHPDQVLKALKEMS